MSKRQNCVSGQSPRFINCKVKRQTAETESGGFEGWSLILAIHSFIAFQTAE